MSVDPQGSSTEATAYEAASGASLIATFYGPRPAEPPRDADTTRSLHRRLDEWEYPIAEKFLHPLINPPGLAAYDTTVVQLGLNAPGNAAGAWETMREQLENMLEAPNLQSVWGYTLVYQAVLAPGADPDEALEELLPAVQRLHSPESSEASEQADMSGGGFVGEAGDRDLARLQPLEQARMAGGDVWLMAIPDEGDGLEAATVYVALSPPKQEEALLDVFYGPGASLLMPDLLAHKVYYHARRYRNDVQDQYEKGLREFRKSTNELLNDLGQQSMEEARLNELDAKEEASLNELARRSNGLAIIVPGLNELQVLMTRQLHSYDARRAEFKGNSIVEYHRKRMNSLILELELMVAHGRDALEWSKAAISQAQVQADKEQERTQREIDEAQDKRQRRIEVVVTIVALALALPHLIEPEATRALLNVWLGWHVPETDEGHLTVLKAQVVIMTAVVATIVGVGALFLLVMRIVRPDAPGKQSGSGKRNKRKPLRPPHTS